MYEDLQYFPGMDPTLPFRILLTGISYCDGSYRISRMKSPLTVLEYVVKGTGSILCDGESFTASSGDVYILRKGTCHTYSSDAKDPWIKLFFNLDGSWLNFSWTSMRSAIPWSCTAALWNPFSRVYPDCLYIRFRYTAHLHQCALFSTAFSPVLYDTKPHTPAISSEAVILRQALDKAVSGSISISQLARAIGRSPDYTTKLFKKTFHITPYAYLPAKLAAAQNLLQNTTLPVQEIARQLGYDDAHYFSNAFKAQLGVSPRAYRQSKTFL
ncbi:MAG: AraC family transcriptional regulator [Clostridia bacterium]